VIKHSIVPLQSTIYVPAPSSAPFYASLMSPARSTKICLKIQFLRKITDRLLDYFVPSYEAEGLVWC
jgi:hypothetical protein